MLKYRLTVDPFHDVLISIDSDDPDVAAPIVFEFSPPQDIPDDLLDATSDEASRQNAIDIIKDVLSQQYGLYGHTIQDSATPADLANTIYSEQIKEYSPVEEDNDLDSLQSSVETSDELLT